MRRGSCAEARSYTPSSDELAQRDRAAPAAAGENDVDEHVLEDDVDPQHDEDLDEAGD